MCYILVVEDEPALGELLEILLTEEGYEVQQAMTAAQALSMAQHRQPSLILFDVSLPDLNGVDFVTRYRELPRSTAALIAVSAIANLAEVATRIGADGFLAKPFEIEDLLSAVARTYPQPHDP
jgi:DNA-binding response OmpR family regulator